MLSAKLCIINIGGVLINLILGSCWIFIISIENIKLGYRKKIFLLISFILKNLN